MRRKPSLSNFRELAGQLKDLLPELRTYVQNPRLVGNWLEEHNPWLSRQVLSAASNLADPYIAGMGLTIEGISEGQVEVSMPHRWRNRGEGGAVHVGALTTLAEFTSRIYWERHLNLSRHQMQVGQIQARFLRETESDTRAVLNLAEAEREAALFKLRAEGHVTVPCSVSVYDSQARLIAEITVEWSLVQPKALGAGSSSGSSSGSMA